jgi:hypothetical protein
LLVHTTKTSVDDDELLLQLDVDLHDGREDDDEGAALLALLHLVGDRLHDLGAAQEPVEVGQHQQRRGVGPRQGADRAEGGEGVGVGGILCAADLQPPVHVPNRQHPLALAAQLGDLFECVGVLVGLDPDAGERGGDELRQPL